MDGASLNLAELVDLLGGKTGLGNHVATALGEAVVHIVGIAYADNVGNLVPIEVGVNTVGAEALALSVQTTAVLIPVLVLPSTLT